MSIFKNVLKPFNILLIIALIVIGFELCSSKSVIPSGRVSGFANPEEEEESPESQGNPSAYASDSGFMQITEPESAKIDIPGCPGNAASFISSNLLPKDSEVLDTTFTEFSPANLKGENFIDSTKYQIGMQSQALRNPNLQLRADPVIPKNENACAWNTSTIGPENTPAGNHLTN
tara:strand:+ start:12385 stop:12909 length:525 start_codon:yes stop_codon:yes gene_type:complete